MVLRANSGVQKKLGKGTKIAYSKIRKTVPILKEDRVLSEDVEKVKQMVKNRIFLDEIEKTLKIDVCASLIGETINVSQFSQKYNIQERSRSFLSIMGN